MKQLPIKTRILQYIIHSEKALTADEIYEGLKSEYADDSFFNRKTVNDYVDSLIGVGFVKADQLEFDKDGNLVIYCVATADGKSREKYMH